MVQPVTSAQQLTGTIGLILQLAVGALIAFFIVKAVTSLERIADGVEALCEAARRMEDQQAPATGTPAVPRKEPESEG